MTTKCEQCRKDVPLGELIAHAGKYRCSDCVYQVDDQED